MKKYIISLIIILFALASSLSAQTTPWHNVRRILRYTPEDGDFVIVNGKIKQNRALYGGSTAFRVETGDVPEFALAFPEMGGNLHFGIIKGENVIQLNDAKRIEAHYGGGRKFYIINDPILGKGKLIIEVVAQNNTEGMIVKIKPENIPSDVMLTWIFGGASNTKFHRQGDLGVDSPDCYDLKPEYCKENKYYIERNHFVLNTGGKKSKFIEGIVPDDILHNTNFNWIEGKTKLKDICYFMIRGKEDASSASSINFPSENKNEIEHLFDIALSEAISKANTLQFHTPDPYFNTLGSDISMAADGIWQPNVWLHGAIGWRMPLCGWRAAYTGDVLGMHEKTRLHFNNYAEAQITDIPQTIPQPSQDSILNLCRGKEEWGTSMYSNGYISRNPGKGTPKMHHYDMNLVYIDELLRHLNWTGDIAYARKMWPVIERSLAWEKRNFDTDNDGLYDAYCCIWASDALEYSGGAVTHSSAYNYYANKCAAKIAKLIGKDPSLYQLEAEKIHKAINNRLWLPNDGHWAEYQDTMGNKLIHPSAGVWTIYHAIDSEVGDDFKNYEATRYVDTQIPHIPVLADNLKDKSYATISTTNWMPYIWSTNNVAPAEVAHTALAYWETGRNEAATKLLKSSILDNMYMGSSPGNLGQISFYDAALGESYRDFGDVVGITSRAIVEGLFGIRPNLLDKEVIIKPGFPFDWNNAQIRTSDVSYNFKRDNNIETWNVRFNTLVKGAWIKLQIPVYKDSIANITLNGKKCTWKSMQHCVERPFIEIMLPCNIENQLVINYTGNSINLKEICEGNGEKTIFAEEKQGEFTWWQPRSVNKNCMEEATADTIRTKMYQTVNLSSVFNDSVSNIFRHKYLSPRPNVTSLEIPAQGIGDWCHPQATASIDDKGIRTMSKNGQITTPDGIPFLTPATGCNIAFTSLWNNYPDSVQIPASGKYRRAWLLMAGTTNQMQSRLENGQVIAQYTDGTEQIYSLRNPENWAPIEQDYYEDGYAFHSTQKFYSRLLLHSGKFTDNVGKTLNLKDNAQDRMIPGGAGILLNMPLNKEKSLKSIIVKAEAYEVIIGLMAITYEK